MKYWLLYSIGFIFLNIIPIKTIGQDSLFKAQNLVIQQDSLRKVEDTKAEIKRMKKEFNRNFYFFVAGFSLLMTIAMFFKSAVNQWENANLYAGLMFLFSFMNAWIWTDTLPIKHLMGNLKMGGLGLWFNQMVPVFTLLLHREFLNTQQERPRVYLFLTLAAWILTLCNTALLVQMTVPFFQSIVRFENIFEWSFLLIEFVLPFLFLTYWKNPILRYATWSSWIIAFSFILYFILSYSSIKQSLPIWFDPVFVLFGALLIDGILFLFALTLRDRQIALEKIKLEQQNTANELKTLRAQMNPHFIFNALNSIKSFTLNNDTEAANFYLTKFSKLIRQVLDNSRNEKITLQNELETLKLYLDMEKLRVGDKFDYEIKVGKEVEAEFIELPPILIQPYVENAIWHGLVHKEGKGKLLIDIDLINDKILVINIIDNGIGRERAMKLKSKTGTTHKSFGMKITAERLDIIKQLYSIETKTIIEDVKNEDGLVVGTKATIEIPI